MIYTGLNLCLLVIFLSLSNMTSFLIFSTKRKGSWNGPMNRLRQLSIGRKMSLSPSSLSMTETANPSIYEIRVSKEHNDTEKVALKHCTHFKKYAERNTYAAHTKAAFDEAVTFVDNFYARKSTQPAEGATKQLVIIDSGCGKGMSTLAIARMFPDIPVIGFDKSINRLSHNKHYNATSPLDNTNSQMGTYDGQKCHNDMSLVNGNNANHNHKKVKNGNIRTENSGNTRKNQNNVEDDVDDDDDDDDDEEEEVDIRNYSNALLIRAELSDFWLLAATSSKWLVHSHYILYPNPYPKSKHLRRRWHGHPVFPALLALGGQLTVRSNWPIYCSEMATALRSIVNSSCLPGFDCKVGHVESYSCDMPMSHFERKYKAANVELFQLQVNLGTRDLSQRMALLGNDI